MSVTKFEVGKHYRTRDGRKAVVKLVEPTYIAGEIEGTGRLVGWLANGNLYVNSSSVFDLLDEWQEQARVMVKMYRHSATGVVRVHSEFLPDCGWELIAQHELVEGEGME